ncbi:uncharacterized protein LOC121871081 isoform X2 [Homarus americanus]|uniref:uncharacterized protein LOC121871081 isoform X2 n=1 Tax=Homarus americanus TaxID=6706 RepID=UPI001C45966F|nr:uncharacterized protein LOC121871081 isoform X2 [Homarus americanus]
MKDSANVSGPQIRDQARVLYAAVARKKNMKSPPPFNASVGWLHKFKARSGTKYAKYQGEVSSADFVAADSFPKIANQIIQEGGYTLDQIFNCDETGLFWKKSPKSTFISKKEKQAKGVKMAKDRFSVLLTCNASGDCLMKPLVIYKYKRPRAYKGCDMSKLNVYWEKTNKGYMSMELSKKWFDDCFIKDAKEYCRKKNVAFKVVLFLDNAPSHARFLVGRHPSIEVVFLPPNTASKIQPLDQEIIANAKLLYYKYVHDKMRKETDTQEEVKEIAETVSSSEEDPPLPSLAAALPGSPTASASTPPPGSPATPTTPAPPYVPATSTMTVTAVWKNYNIRQAVNFFVKAWGNTTKATVRHAWSALLPQLKSVETKRQQPAELMNQVLETVRSIPAPGFQEVTREDLEELMQDGHTNDVEDLLEDEEGGESDDAASDAGETEQRKVTTQKLSLLLGVCTSLQEMIQDIESDSDEREQMNGFVKSISIKYQKQYNERVNARQQSLITRFLSQRRPAEEDQQREVEVDEDIDDIGEMPEDFDFAGFEEVLTEVSEPGARGQRRDGDGDGAREVGGGSTQ